MKRYFLPPLMGALLGAFIGCMSAAGIAFVVTGFEAMYSPLDQIGMKYFTTVPWTGMSGICFGIIVSVIHILEKK